MAERKAMIDREHDLPITKQAEILKVSRGSVYYLPRPVSSADLEIMQRLDRLHLEYPFAGSRMLRGLLALQGCKIGRRHVKTLMRRMGIEALYRRPRTTKPEPGHKIYPYLLYKHFTSPQCSVFRPNDRLKRKANFRLSPRDSGSYTSQIATPTQGDRATLKRVASLRLSRRSHNEALPPTTPPHFPLTHECPNRDT